MSKFGTQEDIRSLLQQIQAAAFKPIPLAQANDVWVLSNVAKLEFETRQVLAQELINKLLKILAGSKPSWQDTAEYVSRFHELKQEQHGKARAGRRKRGWSLQDTANELSMTYNMVARYVAIFKAMRKDPSIKSFKDMSAAMKHVERRRDS